MRTVIVRDAMRIPLGKQGENNAVRVVWPEIAEKYAKLYGEGRFELVVVQRGQVYPAVVNVDGADLVWDVRAADTATAEVGSLELIYYVGDTIAKSQTWETVVVASASAAGTTEPPEDPARVWFDEIKRQIGDLGKLTTKAKENLVAAINEAAQTSSGGADPDDIAKAVADYLAAHPIEETDPTVPEWAKAEITGATVGQIAKIAAVDASGMPTAWSPVDMPTGGGETWELIASGVMAEPARLNINKDNNGLPFSLKSAQIFVRGDISITKPSCMSVQARRWASAKDYDSYFAEVFFGKENPKVNLWYMLREKTMPILFWEAEGNSLWNSADCKVLMGVHRYFISTENVYGKGPLNHLINDVQIGAAMGNGNMAAGCKWEIWGGESMRICENGVYRDMTPEEVAEFEKLAAEAPAPEPTAEERIAALEKDNAELRDALDALLTGVAE